MLVAPQTAATSTKRTLSSASFDNMVIKAARSAENLQEQSSGKYLKLNTHLQNKVCVLVLRSSGCLSHWEACVKHIIESCSCNNIDLWHLKKCLKSKLQVASAPVQLWATASIEKSHPPVYKFPEVSCEEVTVTDPALTLTVVIRMTLRQPRRSPSVR